MEKRTCKHFTNERLFSHCKAGICYRDVMPRFVGVPGVVSQAPCVPSAAPETVAQRGWQALGHQPGTCCVHYVAHTAAEHLAQATKRQRDWQQVKKLFPLLVQLKAQ